MEKLGYIVQDTIFVLSVVLIIAVCYVLFAGGYTDNLLYPLAAIVSGIFNIAIILFDKRGLE